MQIKPCFPPKSGCSHFNTFVPDNLTSECSVYSLYFDKITIYNCSHRSNGSSNIGIVTFHHYELANNATLLYEQFILSNHLQYTLNNGYIYFDVHHTIYDNQEWLEYLEEHAGTSYKAQKPFIINLLFEHFDEKALEHVVWVDFDVLFTNCSNLLEETVNYAHNMYKTEDVSVIFARDANSLSNTGVLIYKNGEYAKKLIAKQTNVFIHAEAFQYLLLDEHHFAD